jgi:hypothetical protein
MKIYLPKLPSERDLELMIEWLEILGPAIALTVPKRAYLVSEALQQTIAFLRRLRHNETWRREGVIEL